MKKILVIDDDLDLGTLLKSFLSKKGYEVQTSMRAKDALLILKREKIDLVLCDYRLPDMNGLEMLKAIKQEQAQSLVIMITGYSDVRTAVITLKQGAYDYVTKPLYPDEILHTIEDAFKKQSSKVSESLTKKKTPAQSKSSLPPKKYQIGKSQAAQSVQQHISLIAPTNMSALIIGETGTGKEFVAKEVHRQSKRAKSAFIAIDCGALPKELAGSELFGHKKGAFTGAVQDKVGSFALANKGTLFLDEIGNLSYDNQIKLLRVLQEQKIKALGDTKTIKVDVRVIAATNEDLREAVKKGDFREDLYHRINEFKIELLPLRERPGDILFFAEYFLHLANEQLNKQVQGFDKEVQEKLKNYYWHGNLRELKNVVKRSVLLTTTDSISSECLPDEILNPVYAPREEETELNYLSDEFNLKTVAEKAERKAIIHVLEQTNFNKSKAAEILEIDRKTLYNKLRSYNIDL